MDEFENLPALTLKYKNQLFPINFKYFEMPALVRYTKLTDLEPSKRNSEHYRMTLISHNKKRRKYDLNISNNSGGMDLVLHTGIEHFNLNRLDFGSHLNFSMCDTCTKVTFLEQTRLPAIWLVEPLGNYSADKQRICISGYDKDDEKQITKNIFREPGDQLLLEVHNNGASGCIDRKLVFKNQQQPRLDKGARTMYIIDEDDTLIHLNIDDRVKYSFNIINPNSFLK